MKIRMIRTNKVMEVEKSYGMRLIEQGKAILEHSNQTPSVKNAEKTKEEGVKGKKEDRVCH